MSLGEFDLIARYFHRPARKAVVGNGDDCAILAPAPGMQLAISTDTLVVGRHFIAEVPAQRLGHKCLAVNLSDLAACGARPLAFTLALTLPEANPDWLEGFAQGLLALADAHGCELVGGDTTAGPLSITITVLGEVPAGGALLRRGAQAGDDCWVSGSLGDARIALETWRGQWSGLPQLSAEQEALAQDRLDLPTPRVAVGEGLRGLASAVIDVSDGLLSDLGHVLQASTRHCGQPLGAMLAADDLPASAAVRALPVEQRLTCLLAGGDDYELLFTAPPAQRDRIDALALATGTPLTRIGRIEPQAGVRLVHGPLDGPHTAVQLPHNLPHGFDHFRD